VILEYGTDEELLECLLANVYTNWREQLSDVLSRDGIYLRNIREQRQSNGAIVTSLEFSVESEEPYAALDKVRAALKLFGLGCSSCEMRRREDDYHGMQFPPALHVEFREYPYHDWESFTLGGRRRSLFIH